MSEQEIFEVSEDSQILTETALNERIIDHPEFGSIRFIMPTLKVQRKIDGMARAKKKMLLNAVDEIEDPDNPTKIKVVPAYQSKEVLAKRYRELGWWTEEHEAELETKSTEHIACLTELEILGFTSLNDCTDSLRNINDDLSMLFEKEYIDKKFPDKLAMAISEVTTVSDEYPKKAEKILRTEAPSTEVDDLLEEAVRQRQIYQKYLDLTSAYAGLLALQQEQNSLFSDSWQEQLRYFMRLAQVHHCVQTVDADEPLWPSLDAMEMETNSDLIRWVFDELSAFWQGLTEEMREKLGKYDFMYGRNESRQSSDDSHVPLESKQDGESQENEQTSSTKVTDTEEI